MSNGTGHPAQPDNLPKVTAASMLVHASEELMWVAETMLTVKPGPKTRGELRRKLSGVIADCETVRLAIPE